MAETLPLQTTPVWQFTHRFNATVLLEWQKFALFAEQLDINRMRSCPRRGFELWRNTSKS
jgi:hypothetical protein